MSGLDWMGWMDGLSYTAVTPRASLQSDANNNDLSTIQVAVYSKGKKINWRQLKSGELPTPRWGLKAAMVGDILYVTGGRDRDLDTVKKTKRNDLTSILAWDPVSESWKAAGNLNVARSDHAAVAIPGSMIKCA